MRILIVSALFGGLVVGAAYSAIKLWGDVAARRYGLGFLGLLSLLGSLGWLILLGLVLSTQYS